MTAWFLIRREELSTPLNFSRHFLNWPEAKPRKLCQFKNHIVSLVLGVMLLLGGNIR